MARGKKAAQAVTDRHRAVAQEVQRRRSVTVAELSRRFHVSPPSIRRDLRYLEGMGILRRVHGGAEAISQPGQVLRFNARLLQNAPLKPLNLPDITISPVEADSKTSKYDLTLNTAETEEGLFCHIEYNTDLFDRPTMERLLKRYHMIVESILLHPQHKISELSLMPEQEFQQLIHEWNQTDIA